MHGKLGAKRRSKEKAFSTHSAVNLIEWGLTGWDFPHFFPRPPITAGIIIVVAFTAPAPAPATPLCHPGVLDFGFLFELLFSLLHFRLSSNALIAAEALAHCQRLRSLSVQG